MGESINLTLHCQLEKEKVEALSAVLQEVAAAVPTGALSCLDSVNVLEGFQIPPTVNKLMQAGGMPGWYVPNPSHPADAVCVPVEGGSCHSCVILISRSIVEPLSTDHVYQASVISAVMEELLHAWVYHEIWQIRGKLDPGCHGDLACEKDLLALAMHMYGEFVVMRMKAQLMGTRALVQPQPGADRVAVGPTYPQSVLDLTNYYVLVCLDFRVSVQTLAKLPIDT
jgi:hypothetical protein